jgi:N-methylhydantoinase A
MTNPIVIGIDAGGTMTDTILVDEDGHFKIGKAATTPRNEADGFIASAEDAADAWGISLEELFSASTWCSIPAPACSTRFCRAPAAGWADHDQGLEDMILMGRGLQAWADYSYADRLHAVTITTPTAGAAPAPHGVTERDRPVRRCHYSTL